MVGKKMILMGAPYDHECYRCTYSSQAVNIVSLDEGDYCGIGFHGGGWKLLLKMIRKVLVS